MKSHLVIISTNYRLLIIVYMGPLVGLGPPLRTPGFMYSLVKSITKFHSLCEEFLLVTSTEMLVCLGQMCDEFSVLI